MDRVADVCSFTCEQICDRLSDYLDGDLDGRALAAVEAHLRGCVGCERYAAELAATILALRQLRRAPCE